MENVNGLSPDLIIHPGESIKEILEERNISQEELAIRCGFTAKHVSEVINGKKKISSKFANSLEYALGISTAFWINLQGIYDREILELERINNMTEKEFKILDELKEIVKYCEKRNIIPQNIDKSMVVLKMRKLLNLNDLRDIPNLPINQIAFRGSKKNKVNIYILYAWQKLCEYLTNNIEVKKEFDKEKLESSYEEIKKTMFLKPNAMIAKLKSIFLECGIVFEVVEHFTGAPVQGFIQKKKDKIILCMTLRQSFIDIFWFTLFHEIGHLIHDDFDNNLIDYSFIESKIEQEADEFAKNILINEKDYINFKKNNNLNYKEIKKFAASQNVIPSIVIGRIQNDTQDFSFLASYKEQYKWATEK